MYGYGKLCQSHYLCLKVETLSAAHEERLLEYTCALVQRFELTAWRIGTHIFIDWGGVTATPNKTTTKLDKQRDKADWNHQAEIWLPNGA